MPTSRRASIHLKLFSKRPLIKLERKLRTERMKAREMESLLQNPYPDSDKQLIKKPYITRILMFWRNIHQEKC